MSKSTFAVSEVQFLGYLVTVNGLKPLPSRVDAVQNYKIPETVKELRRFLGMLNFYRRFIPKAAEHQSKLHALYSGNKRVITKIQWTPERIEAFQTCKEQLAHATLLAYPSLNAPTALWVDASDTGMGGVLQQHINGNWKPIAFYSKN